MDELITIKQLPIIQEQLAQIKGEITAAVENALSLECTEDTYKDVKEVRARLNKDFNALESRRKEVKKTILSPYEQFEAIYKDCVTDVFKPADKQLADKISSVENGLKDAIRNEAMRYFNEYTAEKSIDFLTLENTGVNITLNASKKGIRDTINGFVDKVCDDLAMIDTQEHSAEILYEYKQSLNVSQAILAVNNRHKAVEEAIERDKQAKEIAAKEAEAVKRVEAVEAEVLTAPVAHAAPVVDSKVYTVSFIVRTTSLDKIRALKNFLVEGEYEYEQR